MTTSLYDGFDEYDRFVNWERRLAYEIPFITQQLDAAHARQVLDAACGTGRHAAALAKLGYGVTGSDLSKPMIERARANAQAEGREDAEFFAAGFGEIAKRTSRRFDAVLCLGNSLPHVLTLDALKATMRDFAELLVPNGLLLIQNRNLGAVVAGRQRWMPPLSQRDAAGGREWTFLRFYDFEQDGTLTFNVITLERQGTGKWSQDVKQTTLRPWSRDQWVAALQTAGLGSIVCYGDMTGRPHTVDSPNLIITARRNS